MLNHPGGTKMIASRLLPCRWFWLPLSNFAEWSSAFMLWGICFLSLDLLNKTKSFSCISRAFGRPGDKLIPHLILVYMKSVLFPLLEKETRPRLRKYVQCHHRQYMMESRFNGLHVAKIALLNVMLHIFSNVIWLQQVFWNKHFILLHFIYYFVCVCVWRHMSQCLHGGQWTVCRNQFSLSTRRILGTELRLRDLTAGAFIYWDISPALKQPGLRVPSFYD